jgi:feruloyl-CoA synthase
MNFTTRNARIVERNDGSIVLSNDVGLASVSTTMVDWLDHWADHDPDRCFIAEKDGSGAWSTLSYGAARAAARKKAALLLRTGADAQRPLAILSGNGIAHAQMALGAMYVGIPVAPISPGYALLSSDFDKLSSVFETLDAAAVYVERTMPFERALAHLASRFKLALLSGENEVPEQSDAGMVAARRSQVVPDTVAKILFTSGSTGAPKGVINTHRMWATNQEQLRHAWQFLADSPPLLLDWLPWNHTFGGNHNFGLVLRNGGTLYIDDGKATEAGIQATAANLLEVCPNLYFNVPKGFDLLVPRLRGNEALRRSFFKNLRAILSAAAALPTHLRDELLDLSRRELGKGVPVLNAWGATETAPTVTLTPEDSVVANSIGLPLPESEVKLVPLARAESGKYEMRVRGPNVFAGYWRRDDLHEQLFDDEGFYRIGDVGCFADPMDRSQGLAFAGRTAEEFKLLTGTWVQASAVRMATIEASAPLAQDVVVAGENRDFIAVLIFPNWDACRRLALCDVNVDRAELVGRPEIVAAVKLGLSRAAQLGGGGSTFARRAILQVEPPSFDQGEITDKGQLNQANVLRQRSTAVAAVYADLPDDYVICL